MFLSSLGPVPSLLAGLLSRIALSAYYPAYLLAFWVPGVAGAAFFVGRGRNRPVLGAVLAASTYVPGWAAVYGFVTGTLHGIPGYLTTRGAAYASVRQNERGCDPGVPRAGRVGQGAHEDGPGLDLDGREGDQQLLTTRRRCSRGETQATKSGLAYTGSRAGTTCRTSRW